MAKSHEHGLALLLRRRGMSYGQIKKQLRVSKSTLSLWLRQYPLSAERLRSLRDWNEVRIEHFRQTMERKREGRHAAHYRAARKRLLPLSRKELLVAGLLLYWGEGAKYSNNSVGISNSDPQVIRFALRWLVRALLVPKAKVRVRLHLYKDMDIRRELHFWSEELGIPPIQFGKPYIKESKRAGIDYRSFGHGTCNLEVYNSWLHDRILMSIKAIADTYGKRP